MNNIILTEKQQKGLDIIIDRFLKGEKYTVIAGYAGTGKSTLVKHAVKAFAQYGVDEMNIGFGAFTGKAALVLQNKGNKNAQTLHKLLYRSVRRPDGTYTHIPKTEIPYRVLVIDEISMVPREMIELLNKMKKVYVICLGDPFQLPPISKNQDNHLLDKPHIFLDEIMRQALDSEIIELSMRIREGKKIEPFIGKEVQIYAANDLSTGMLTWADQVLVATNKKRKVINNYVRELLGFEGGPQDGDKVISLKNDWDVLNSSGSALVNGTIGWLSNSYNTYTNVPYYYCNEYFDKSQFRVLRADVKDETDSVFESLSLDKDMIETGLRCCDSRTEARIGASKKDSWILPKQFEYGYAITVHRAQGSEWNNILVVEEKFPFEKTEHARWLYTACTRASERLVLILKE